MQKDRWEDEYARLSNIPSTDATRPSRCLLSFIKEHPDLKGHALDLGSGNGRNCLYLAGLEFKAEGIELAGNAVEDANRKAKEAGLDDKVSFIEGSIGERFPYNDSVFDLAIDMMAFHLLNKDERQIYVNELRRVLKKGGYYLIRTLSSDSPAILKLLKESPGPEENSYIIPESGMVEKSFTRQDLVDLFQPFSLEKAEFKEEVTPAFNSAYEVNYHELTFRY